MAGDGESPAKCREPRRLRIESDGETSTRGEKRAGSGESPAAEKRTRTAGPEQETAPPKVAFGSVSLCGLSREMEDAVAVRPGFCRLPGGEPLHFFAVFDGHGGSHVSAMCRERMHELVAEEMGKAPAAAAGSKEEAEGWKAALGRAFARMDELALASCACGKAGPPMCGCERSGFESDVVGSTAVVAIVSRSRIFVANCGDSRAVLSRSGRALPLSDDHKPDRADELARIEAAGGRVIYLNGARVHGILAMSRALGDKYLKPVVISEPEMVVMERTQEDECMVIASDGLWDVISNKLACDVARRCLEDGAPSNGADDVARAVTESVTDSGEEQASSPRCSLAATLLARLALGRKSADNISVIVVDLKRGFGH
ncbi:hypothetical protein J5N97_023159 [Dioscorea zingiberensis]|uniref:protein-serine/threonine phosphatase n=1 Tax=Dioscorea zingiberensis TaxID=325984 RepID=A0A9D5CBS6_9LILI|nr:hypothetical protein J5N97_023159 [Dioscorea zingiberensis]